MPGQCPLSRVCRSQLHPRAVECAATAPGGCATSRRLSWCKHIHLCWTTCAVAGNTSKPPCNLEGSRSTGLACDDAPFTPVPSFVAPCVCMSQGGSKGQAHVTEAPCACMSQGGSKGQAHVTADWPPTLQATIMDDLPIEIQNMMIVADQVFGVHGAMLLLRAWSRVRV